MQAMWRHRRGRHLCHGSLRCLPGDRSAPSRSVAPAGIGSTVRLPGSVRVGHRAVPVALRRFDDPADYGQYLLHHDRIEINQALGPSLRASVLVHEILHAMFATAMIPVDDATEETVIRALTPQILALIRDNPRLIAALAAR